MDAAPWLQDVGMAKQPPPPPPSSLELPRPMPPQPPPMPPQPSHLAEKRARPQKEQALNCPRCNSTNTKFCYYNNYSLTQPRYFCKTCRRYWTEGGSLRNVPVGGGSRKNKRSSSSSSSSAPSSSTPSKKLQPDVHHGVLPPLENPKFLEGHDLNLSFQGAFPPAMELMRTARGMGAFVPMHVHQEVVYPHQGGGGFALQDFRSSAVGFPVEESVGANAGTTTYEGMQEVVEGGNGAGRVLFPFEDLSHVPPPPNSGAAGAFDQRQQADPSGFWNGVIGGGGASW